METRKQKVDRQRGHAADKAFDPIRTAIDAGDLTITPLKTVEMPGPGPEGEPIPDLGPDSDTPCPRPDIGETTPPPGPDDIRDTPGQDEAICSTRGDAPSADRSSSVSKAIAWQHGPKDFSVDAQGIKYGTLGVPLERRRDPTERDLADPRFQVLWELMKRVDVDYRNGLFSGATGNDVCAVLDALNACEQPPATRPADWNPTEALFAFMGWLTSRQAETPVFSSHHDASPAVALIRDFSERHHLPPVRDGWHDLIVAEGQNVHV